MKTEQIRMVNDLKSEYTKLREDHAAKSKQYDKDEDWISYMAERNMEAYCRGFVAALEAASRILHLGE